jgi:hypothetical protein
MMISIPNLLISSIARSTLGLAMFAGLATAQAPTAVRSHP